MDKFLWVFITVLLAVLITVQFCILNKRLAVQHKESRKILHEMVVKMEEHKRAMPIPTGGDLKWE